MNKLFALSLTLVTLSSSAAFSLQAYEFGKVKFEERYREENLPMMCDDSYYTAVVIPVAGALGSDFKLSIAGDSDCKLSNAKARQGVTHLLIKNTGNCTITLEKLVGKGSGNKAVFNLSDAC